jgi:hypothetical protein
MSPAKERSIRSRSSTILGRSPSRLPPSSAVTVAWKLPMAPSSSSIWLLYWPPELAFSVSSLALMVCRADCSHGRLERGGVGADLGRPTTAASRS